MARAKYFIDRIKYKAAQGDLPFTPLKNSHMVNNNIFKTIEESEKKMYRSRHFDIGVIPSATME